MPCWYFEKKEIQNSPTYRDGIDSGTECRYRREGARFINDAGTKLGLRYDTCATGVVYFHRFYMFHSFKDFPRYITAACCLFLAGKVEETPKKCKDIIKISQQILHSKQFAQFGNDPKEEVMTLERILLQTIKFDLQTEHPYAYLLKYAKLVRADKEKVQKLVQMAWIFINDSLCTTLCLQWEPEIIAASLMYLGTKLNKLEITDWSGKVPGTKQNWFESIIPDLTIDLMEDVCHQVLDLYSSSSNQAPSNTGESPPPPPPGQNPSRTPNSQGSDKKRSLQSTPSDPVTPGSHSVKSIKLEAGSQSRKTTPQKNTDKARGEPSLRRIPSQGQITDASQPTLTTSSGASASSSATSKEPNPSNPASVPQASFSSSQYSAGSKDLSQHNPYVSSSQYQSSFMSGEGAQSLQSIMGTQPGTYTQASNPASQFIGYTLPPPPVAGAPAVNAQYGIPGPPQYPPGYNPSQYPASAAPPGPPVAQPPYKQQQPGQSYSQYPSYSKYQHPPPTHNAGYDQYRGTGSNNYGTSLGQRQRPGQSSHQTPQPQASSNITNVNISGR